MRFLLLAMIANCAWGCVCGAWSGAKQNWQRASVVVFGNVEPAIPEFSLDRMVFRNQKVVVKTLEG